MLHYLVWCARILDVVSLYYFFTEDETVKSECKSFLEQFIEAEEGCGHIPGDRYAASLIWPILILFKAGARDKALDLVKKGVIWLCDRVEKGAGLASFEADEYEETSTLVGYPFEFIKVSESRASYLATILADLAAFIGDKELYSLIINDFEACGIVYPYWQFPDTTAVFTIETRECIAYANITHQHTLGHFEDYEYAEHIKHEPASYQIVAKAGLNSLVLLSFLLKDRYFPKLWKNIISENAQ